MNVWRSFSTWLLRASKTRAFNEGERIDLSEYNYTPFQNNYNKLVTMYQARQYHANHTPYQYQFDKLAHEQAVLHKQLNFLQARLMGQRVLLILSVLGVYYYFIKQQETRDWGDRYDYKFMVSAYGGLEDTVGQGDTSMDD